MEGIHGVDVSWTHHSQPKGKVSRKMSHLLSLPARKKRASRKKVNAVEQCSLTQDLLDRSQALRPVPDPQPASNLDKDLPSPQRTASFEQERFPDFDSKPTRPNINGALPNLNAKLPATPPGNQASSNSIKKAGGLLRRNSREVVPVHNGQNGNSLKGGTRRTSWMASLSSKLSSQPASPQAQSTNVTASGQIAQSPQGAALQRTPSPGASQRNSYIDESSTHVPHNPKSGGNSFFSNALRRLSSSSQLTPSGKVNMQGGVCERRVLNIDPYRQRCLLPELDSAKLRRVAFCVDVEIAGGPRYKDENETVKNEKAKDKKIKERAEGEALKNPDVVLIEKENTDPNGETPEAPTPAEAEVKTEKKEMTRKKEKKRRSEEERKERKEQKRRKAEESGSIPMVITRDVPPATPNGADAPQRPLNRPTTDPLRIYRRCCQLRETPVLKRISDQLGALANCPLKEPGAVLSLDLTGSRLQLTDIVTLSDWLAIVPVTKLILEDADINDEGVRVILAGLLAAGTPDFSRTRSPVTAGAHEERSGVVEKLSLKNNPKVTRQGWKHISLFIHMCKSLRQLDLSMLKFPDSPAEPTSPESAVKATDDIAEIFAKAISERYGGSRFEELLLGECNLKTHQIRKIVDAVMVSGLTRLGVAGNNIDMEALGYLVHYIRSGVCQGLDLGGNDLREHLDVLGDALEHNKTVWALSLADCNLQPASLKPLFPGLLNLQSLRFLDLSHNPELFASKPSAVGILRKYLPMLTELRRFHLNHCDMAPNQAIALADVLAECPQLAHLSILENPQLSALANATDDETQEEAVALYASLMSACRVSTSLISIDVEVPAPENSEIVKALAKQMVAYSLRNMEQWSFTTVSDTASSSDDSDSMTQASTSYTSTGSNMPELRGTRSHAKDVEVPEVLQHIVGSSDQPNADPAEDDLAPNNDYIVGGTGVVRALNYCLTEFRRGSASMPQSGNVSPSHHPAIAGRAKAMSKDLLESARKIRIRLHPALRKESMGNDDMAYRKCFLTTTLLYTVLTCF
jgi:hypothetical protein